MGILTAVISYSCIYSILRSHQLLESGVSTLQQNIFLHTASKWKLKTSNAISVK